MRQDKSIQDVMTTNLSTVEPATSIKEAAQLMKREDVGALAEGRLEATVGDIASKDVVSIDPQQSLDEAARLMAEHQIRRLPVCEEDGRLVGILAQADVAQIGHDQLTGEVVQRISQ